MQQSDETAGAGKFKVKNPEMKRKSVHYKADQGIALLNLIAELKEQEDVHDIIASLKRRL